MDATSSIIETLKASLPAVVTRDEAHKATGGLVNKRSLANMDSLGVGPGGRVKFGHKTGYEKTAFLQWLETRLQDADKVEVA